MALISDAGCPGIADPGADLVLIAHKSKVSVHPFVGPSSILLALMGSGLNGQQFAFNGYLPIDKQSVNKLSKILNESRLKQSNPNFYRNTLSKQPLF